MAKIAVHNLAGNKVGDIELSEKVFGLPANDDLVHQIYVAQTANQRQVLADTKTRGERAGSGIKPWRQKGTGRARVGSVRNPAWRKGGVAFGPTNDRNFKQKINKKMNSKAIAIVLSGKTRDAELKIIDKFDITEKKTKKVAEALEKMKLKGKTLMVFSDSEKELAILSRNIPRVSNISVKQLNVLDMLKHKNLIISKESALFLEKKYS